jgi:hypothetical protein
MLLMTLLVDEQGDQIGRIFAHRMMVYLEQIIKKLHKQPKLFGYFFSRLRLRIIFDKRRKIVILTLAPGANPTIEINTASPVKN